MIEKLDTNPEDPATAWADPPGLGRALTIGIAIGVAISFCGVAGPFLAGGQGWGASIGMGVFVAAWGGLGFGVMIGGVVWATRVERAAERERLEARTLPPALVQAAHPDDEAGQAISRQANVEHGQAALEVAS